MITADRPHVWLPGSTAAPLLLLHGTGGDEHDLVPVRDLLAPGHAALAPRGTVLENGMPRFFRRVAEGVFDEDDLHRRAAELAAFLAAQEAVHDVRPGSWVAVGFSNGANIASALLLDRPGTLAAAALFAAMVPFRDEQAGDLAGTRVAVANGRRDPLATPEVTATLVERLRRGGADVAEFPHAGGHTVDSRSFPAISRFLGLRAG